MIRIKTEGTYCELIVFMADGMSEDFVDWFKNELNKSSGVGFLGGKSHEFS